MNPKLLEMIGKVLRTCLRAEHNQLPMCIFEQKIKRFLKLINSSLLALKEPESELVNGNLQNTAALMEHWLHTKLNRKESLSLESVEFLSWLTRSIVNQISQVEICSETLDLVSHFLNETNSLFKLRSRDFEKELILRFLNEFAGSLTFLSTKSNAASSLQSVNVSKEIMHLRTAVKNIIGTLSKRVLSEGLLKKDGCESSPRLQMLKSDRYQEACDFINSKMELDDQSNTFSDGECSLSLLVCAIFKFMNGIFIFMVHFYPISSIFIQGFR